MFNDSSAEDLVLRLMTPLVQCVLVRPGAVDAELVETLRQNDFDNAPLSGTDGIVLTSYLEQLLASNRPLSAEDPAIDRTMLDSTARLREMLETVAAHNAVLVSDHGKLAGILTLSDLNKHPLRSLLYASLANLETELAESIRRICPDPWDWILELSEENQVHVIGYWEVTKRKNIDIGALAACTLTQLIRIVSTLERVRLEFGFKSRAAAEATCSSLPTLRNKVMHPVRPLIGKSDEIADLVSSINKVELLMSMVPRKGKS
jgi:hypothetical protein